MSNDRYRETKISRRDGTGLSARQKSAFRRYCKLVIDPRHVQTRCARNQRIRLNAKFDIILVTLRCELLDTRRIIEEPVVAYGFYPVGYLAISPFHGARAGCPYRNPQPDVDPRNRPPFKNSLESFSKWVRKKKDVWTPCRRTSNITSRRSARKDRSSKIDGSYMSYSRKQE